LWGEGWISIPVEPFRTSLGRDGGELEFAGFAVAQLRKPAKVVVVVTVLDTMASGVLLWD
jgi:hypothetical protein